MAPSEHCGVEVLLPSFIAAGRSLFVVLSMERKPNLQKLSAVILPVLQSPEEGALVYGLHAASSMSAEEFAQAYML